MASQLIAYIGQISCFFENRLQALTTNHRLRLKVMVRSFMNSTLYVIFTLTTRDYVENFLSEKQVLAFSLYPVLNVLFEMSPLCVFFVYMALLMHDISQILGSVSSFTQTLQKYCNQSSLSN
jgi:hypothetical protein